MHNPVTPIVEVDSTTGGSLPIGTQAPLPGGGVVATSDPVAKAAGVLIGFLMTVLGKLINKPYCLPAQHALFNSNGAALAQNDTIVFAAGAAGVRNYLTSMQLSNGATASVIKITDGAGGTVLWAMNVPANQGIVDIDFPVPIRGSAATALVVNSAAVGGTVQMAAQGYTAAE